MMKFRYVKILEEPEAELLIQASPTKQLEDYVSANDVILATLGALQASDSLDTFYASYIKDSNDKTRDISNSAERIRKILEVREKKYAGLLVDIIGAFSSGKVQLKTNTDYHKAILSLLNGRVIQMIDNGASDDGLLELMVDLTYIYYSYVFHNAFDYFKSGITNIDRNDYEDGCMCLHLSLKAPNIFVTDDRNFKRLLTDVLSFINGLNDVYFESQLQVHDTKYLTNLACS